MIVKRLYQSGASVQRLSDSLSSNAEFVQLANAVTVTQCGRCESRKGRSHGTGNVVYNSVACVRSDDGLPGRRLTEFVSRI